MPVTIGADSMLAEGAILQVALASSADSFRLQQGDSTIAHEIKQDGSGLNAGSAVLCWTQGEEIHDAATLNLEVTGSIDGLPCGSCTDALTFKASGVGREGFGAEWQSGWKK